MSERDDPREALVALLELMVRLRDPQRGCPWDREQTFHTLARHTLEEAYEVADAVEQGEPTQLRDELGDLLFQVVFHARLAEEKSWFDFTAVARAIYAKLIRRHPHVFEEAHAGTDAGELSLRWEEQKARERAAAALEEPIADHSALADIPRALPALTRAAKLGRRAARVGFDWEEASQVRDKVLEEVREVEAVLAAEEGAADDSSGTLAHTAGLWRSPGARGAGKQERLAEEVGDLLFAVANWGLHLGVDPEEALRAANGKFERRFRHMEVLAGGRGTALEALDAAQWDALWRQAKQEG